jgi:hypothetical protein
MRGRSDFFNFILILVINVSMIQMESKAKSQWNK